MPLFNRPFPLNGAPTGIASVAHGGDGKRNEKSGIGIGIFRQSTAVLASTSPMGVTLPQRCNQLHLCPHRCNLVGAPDYHRPLCPTGDAGGGQSG